MKIENLRYLVNYSEKEVALRKFAIEEKLTSVEEIAVMSLSEVCELFEEKYEIAYHNNDEIGLVYKEDLPKFNNLVKRIGDISD